MLVPLTFFLGLWFQAAAAAPGDSAPAAVKERLTYKMRYGQFQAGQFQIEAVKSSDTALTLKATMRTPALYRKFFWADNVYATEVDQELLPQRVVKEIRQKNIAHTIEYLFDRSGEVARTTDGRQWQAPMGTRDILSLVYHLRMYPLVPGEKRAYILDGEGLVWRLTAENLGPEHVRGPAGSCTADKVLLRFIGTPSPGWRAWKTDILTNRLSSASSGIFIWFSVGEARVPVQMLFLASPFDLRMTLERTVGVSLQGEGH